VLHAGEEGGGARYVYMTCDMTCDCWLQIISAQIHFGTSESMGQLDMPILHRDMVIANTLVAISPLSLRTPSEYAPYCIPLRQCWRQRMTKMTSMCLLALSLDSPRLCQAPGPLPLLVPARSWLNLNKIRPLQGFMRVADRADPPSAPQDAVDSSGGGPGGTYHYTNGHPTTEGTSHPEVGGVPTVRWGPPTVPVSSGGGEAPEAEAETRSPVLTDPDGHPSALSYAAEERSVRAGEELQSRGSLSSLGSALRSVGGTVASVFVLSDDFVDSPGE